MSDTSGPSKVRLLILYGSETGTAQDVAEGIWRQAIQFGIEAQVEALDDFPVGSLIYEKAVVFVVATTGQGDPPRNMSKSWAFLLRRSLPSNSLVNSKVAVLGLGDSSYAKYNWIGKALHRRLTEGLGATPLCPLGLADDQHDLGPYGVIDPWTASLWDRLRDQVYHGKVFKKDVTPVSGWVVNVVENVDSSPLDVVSHEHGTPYQVQLSNNERTTSNSHFQDVRLIKLSCEVPFEYEPGDVALVFPENSPEAVSKLFSLIRHPSTTGVALKERFVGMKLPPPLRNRSFTLGQCAVSFWDLSMIPGRRAFEILAEVTTSELEREKLHELTLPQNTQDLYDYINRPRRSVLELLVDFPGACEGLSLTHLFSLFRPIRPRPFSIASSPLEKELQLLVAVVDYRTKLKTPRLGLCSNWLASLRPGHKFTIKIRRGALRFPKTPRPVVMVACGTGVAAFRSYIVTQVLSKSDTPLVLFFGCRGRRMDFHFENDWTHLDGRLRVFTAFSRDQPHKIYVQHVMKTNKEVVQQAIEQGGSFFYAGSSKEVPQAVRDALISCLTTNEIDMKEAMSHVEKMETQGKYQTETWS